MIFEVLRNYFVLVLLFCSSTLVNAGLNQFTELVFVEEWLIERKVDLTIKKVECRASIPTHANWFGARIRLGPSYELINPSWISIKEDQLLDSKLDEVKKLLEKCRSGLLFLPDNI